MEQTPIEKIYAVISNIPVSEWKDFFSFNKEILFQSEKERDKQTASLAFDAGFERGASVSLCALVKLESIIPNKEEYLNSLTK